MDRYALAARSRWLTISCRTAQSVSTVASVTLALREECDFVALKRALDRIVAEQDILRVSFSRIEDRVELRVADPDVGFPLDLISARDTATPNKDFHLLNPPLIGGELLQYEGAGQNEPTRLRITAHRTVFDRYSANVLIRELERLYEAFVRSGIDSSPGVPARHAHSSPQLLQPIPPEELGRQLQEWKHNVALAEPLKLPSCIPPNMRGTPPAEASHSSEGISGTLYQLLRERVMERASELHVSPRAILVAAWAQALGRWTGQDDIILGARLLNRDLPELKGLMGPFESTSLVRIKWNAGVSVDQLIRQTHTTLTAAAQQTIFPLEYILSALRVEGNCPRLPLVFAEEPPAPVLNQEHSPFAEPPSRAIELGSSLQSTTDFYVCVDISDTRLTYMLHYNAERFDRHTVERFAASWEELLSGMTTDVERHVTDLPLLPRPEWHQIINEFNATSAPYPEAKLIHEAFEEQVHRTPTAVAVICGAQSLTYAELNSRANQLAHALREHGVGPDQLVALCVERNAGMLIGLLGILKAGGAYVPLDPGYPAERLRYMLNDAAPRVVITQEHLQKRVSDPNVPMLVLDGQWDDFSGQPTRNLETRAIGQRPDQLAYMIYTSGSTGHPKGVLIEHRHVLNLWKGLEALYPPTANCPRVAMNASLNFDASVQQYVQLLSGRTLIIVPQEVRQDAMRMLTFLGESKVDAIDCTPSQLRAWMWAGVLTHTAPRLKTILVGGEAIDPELWSRMTQTPEIAFFNVYGPTECTVDSTADRITADVTPHIGRPMSNRRIYVLDRYRHPVPIGVTGEIYIGGAGIARGYHERPELTAERFLQDLFVATPGARMYRTGDLGRWRADGTIEYLGRNDEQVKIRGFRIELGEIEAQLRRDARVKEAVVVAREDNPGEKRLVAYLIPEGDQDALSAESLRTGLKSLLPEHMVPAAFVVLERFPLSPNGKLDRRALPAPDETAFARGAYEAPRGETETLLAQIWQTLLRVPQVGRQDEFFQLGGHSLLIVQMKERLRRAGWSIAVRSVYDNPTLAGVASRLEPLSLTHSDQGSRIPTGCEAITPEMVPLVALTTTQLERIVSTVPGGASNIKDIYPLAPLQEGILFHHLLSAERGDTYVLPLLLSGSSPETLQALIRGLQQVIERHDILRTAVLWEQLPRPVQVVYRQVTLPVQEILLDIQPDPVKSLQERLRPEHQSLDLHQAPLMRLQIVKDRAWTAPGEPDRWYAILQTHHLVCDNGSLHVLLSELKTCMEGRGEQLPESVPYRHHVTQALQAAQQQQASAFFRSKLADIEEPTAPFGLLDVHGDGSQTEQVTRALEAPLAQRIRLQARRHGVSAATLFHAAWALVVARTSARDDVVFGTVLLGRLQGDAGGQRTLGMFINTLPLRVRLGGESAHALVQQVHRELIELLSHEQCSLAEAQRCSGISGGTPLFTALLNYRHSAADLESRFENDRWEILAGGGGTNYPMTLSVDDQGEGFELTLQTDQRLPSQRAVGYVQTALHSLLEALEHKPEHEAVHLSILPEPERQQLIEGFNATAAPYPQEKLIHELFEEQVARNPAAVAVVDRQQSLTYAELNAKANQLAYRLRGLGVGPDQLVALCVERTAGMFVGLLGILKAGAACVPLDPDHPAERLSYMLEDAAPKVLVTHEHLQNRMSVASVPIIALKDAGEADLSSSTRNLEAARIGLRSDHLAYMIYTSGSTGRPKGVLIEHGHVMNLWKGLETIYPSATHCQRVALNASLNFDASVQQYVQLLSGRTIVIVPQEIRRDAAQMLEFLSDNKLDAIDCTPSQLRTWMSAGVLSAKAPRLKTVLVGGEAIDTDLWNRIAQLSEIAFFNVYGPTECTVDSTAARILERVSPHIGSPMLNRRIYILDKHQEPVPLDVVGELYIGGAGIGRGYHHRPELTAERFLRDPFGPDVDGRMYRTGDLGKWRPDGTIEYLGRNDDQVKIRGFRIELGEIQAQLVRYQDIEQAVVVARQDTPGDTRLIAYVVPKKPISGGSDCRPSVTGVSADCLRSYLKQSLPEHMVPAAFVFLEQLPLTPSGKIDNRALPPPERHSPDAMYQPPKGEVEEVLAGIWQSVLHLERVGRQDDFFELGGHSLLATQVVVRIRAVLSIDVPVKQLFFSSRLSDLAVAIDRLREHRMAEVLAEGGENIEMLLQQVVSMPESQVNEWIGKLSGGRP